MGSRHYLYDGNPGWERRVNEQWAKEQIAEDEYVKSDEKKYPRVTGEGRYTVEFTDRKKVFHVSAIDPHEAVTKAAGQRLYSASQQSRDVNQSGLPIAWVFHCNIRDGATVRGSTPVRNARAYVSIV
jgi:hypothetical protein